MPIKRRVIKPRPIKVEAKPLSVEEALDRMGALLQAGHGTAEQARFYMIQQHTLTLRRLQSIAAKAEAEKTWSFMDGCFKQATELYVLASILYERFPEHVIMSDGAYDQLARFLLKHLHKLPQDFRHWYAITAMDLRAGTGHKVVVQSPIRWMVFILTGKWIEDGPQDNPGLLQEPAGAAVSGVAGKTGKRTFRKLRKA